MKVRVLYFSMIRRALGAEEEEYELDSGSTINSLIDKITQRHSSFVQWESSMMFSRNEEWSARDEVLQDGDIVGVMPPVSGG